MASRSTISTEAGMHESGARGKDRRPPVKDRVKSTLRQELAKAKEADLLIPQVAYGHFAANAEGNDLIIWKDETRSSRNGCVSTSHANSRSPGSASPTSSAPPLRVKRTSPVSCCAPLAIELRRRRHNFWRNEYQNYLFLHGLSVEMAEATAEYWHKRIREGLGFADEDGPSLEGLFRQTYRGGRYSWGYPACPDLNGQRQGGRQRAFKRGA